MFRIDERLPARGILHPEMRKALVVVNPEYALDLAEKVHGSHIHCAFVVGGELGQIIEDLRLRVYSAVRLDPLEAFIQKSGDRLRVALAEGIGQTLVRLAERGRFVGSGERPAR